MFKMYLNGFYGQDPKAWENNWKDISISETINFASYNNPYKIDFDKYCLPGKKVIEAGCGVGAFVMSYAKKGCNIIGIDFAQDTVNKIKSKIKGFPIECASLENIPYPDNSFDVYLSIGVIEHFEEGPFKVLKEAYRVIKPDGCMILTIPWINICKKSKYIMDSLIRGFNNKLLRFDDNCHYEMANEFKIGKRTDFYQYEFTEKEILDILEKGKFNVLHKHGISVVYGVDHIPFLGPYFFSKIKKAVEKIKSKKNNDSQVISKPETIPFDLIDIPPLRRGNFIKEFIKDIIIRENTSNAFGYPIIRLLQEFCGDFLLIICKPLKHNAGGS